MTDNSNFCSIRLSWALKLLGIDIPIIRLYNASNQYINQRTVKANDQKNYIQDANTANDFLRKKFGPPTISIPGNTPLIQILQQLNNVNGDL